MTTYGLTIKRIREDKKMLQKEVYQQIVGRTFSYHFEKGEHDISAEKLVLILKNLNISFDDFLLIHHQYLYEPNSELYQQIFKALTTHNLGALKHLYLVNYNSSDINQKVIAVYSYAMYLINTRKSLKNEVVIFLKNYLIQQSSWTLTDTELFQFVMVIFVDQVDYLNLIMETVMQD